MPIYEYKCRDCEDEFEIIQKVSDRLLRRCKKCGGRLEKLFSQTSFVLKGGGWYSDGYSAKAAAGKPDEGAAKKESAKADSKTKADKPKSAKKTSGGSD